MNKARLVVQFICILAFAYIFYLGFGLMAPTILKKGIDFDSERGVWQLCCFLLSLMSILGVIVLFVKHQKITTIIAVIIGVLSILSFITMPNMKFFGQDYSGMFNLFYLSGIIASVMIYNLHKVGRSKTEQPPT